MEVLKLLPLHNTMFKKIIYRFNCVVKLTGLSHDFHDNAGPSHAGGPVHCTGCTGDSYGPDYLK